MAELAEIEVRVRVVPFSRWDAIKLRIAGPEARQQLLAFLNRLARRPAELDDEDRQR